MSIPKTSSDPGCLFSSQIPPCGPQLRPAEAENHGNTIFPSPGWSPARSIRLGKCCSQAKPGDISPPRLCPGHVAQPLPPPSGQSA